MQSMPFSMPMFRPFVPERIRPWIYVCFALTFYLSGGLYMGLINQMVGETSLIREDLLMCLYANLAGIAIYFPMLFRMKYRFTNKTLLCGAATGVLVCNLVAPHITYLPLLWAVCFIEGMCKIQGTFECNSNIQRWITPQRDFSAFFPVLHMLIFGGMQLSSILSVYLMYHYHWRYMNLFICGAMMVDLLVLTVCTRHFRMFKKLPLYGIDWLGGVLWAVLLLEIAFFFNYGYRLDWWNSPVIRGLAVAILITLAICVGRMFAIRHPYFEPKMWTYHHLVPTLGLIALIGGFLAAENVLESVFTGQVMHYPEMISTRFKWLTLVGVLTGCLFAYWWLHVKRYSIPKLAAIGIAGLTCYFVGYYFTLSADIHISQLYLAVACRGFAYAVMNVTLMLYLAQIIAFQHFFQALSVFEILSMVVGTVIGAAIYTQGYAYYMTDNMARYGELVDNVSVGSLSLPFGEYMTKFVPCITEISIKEIYGWAAYVCIFVLLVCTMHDTPIRKAFKRMPLWKDVRKTVAASLSYRQNERKAHS